MSTSTKRREEPGAENRGGNEDEQMKNDLRKVSSKESKKEQSTTVVSNEFAKIKVKMENELKNANIENTTAAAYTLDKAIVVLHRPMVVKAESECATGAVNTASVTEKETNTMPSSQNDSTIKVAVAKKVAETTDSTENETGNVSIGASTVASKDEESVKIKAEPLTENDIAKKTTKTVESSMDSETDHGTSGTTTEAASAPEQVTTILQPLVPITAQAEHLTEDAVVEKITTANECSTENETAETLTQAANTITKQRSDAAPTSLGNETENVAEIITEDAIAGKVTATTESSTEFETQAINTTGEQIAETATQSFAKETEQAVGASLTTTTVVAIPVKIKAEPLTEDAIVEKVTATAESSIENETQAINTIAEQIAETDTPSLANETGKATRAPSITTTVVAEPVRIKAEPLTEDTSAEKITATVESSLGNGNAHIATEAPSKAKNTVAEQRAEAASSSLSNETGQATGAPSITTTVDTAPVRIKAEPITGDATADKVTEPAESSIINETRNLTEENPAQTQPAGSDDSMDSTEDGEIPDPPLPDDFFEDLLKSADEIKLAAMSPPRPSEESSTKIPFESNAGADAIPEHFFDDLLVDRVAERLADAANEDLETKFSEKLKELKKLELELETGAGTHKKSRKSKKKSHKSSRSKNRQSRERSRSRSNSSGERSRHKRHRSRSRSVEKRIKVKSEFTSSYGSLNKVGSLFPHDLYQPEPEVEKVQTEPTIILLDSPPPAPTRTTTTSIRVKNEFSTFIPSVFEDHLECLPVKSATAPIANPSTTFSDAPTTSKRSMSAIEDTAYTGLKRIKLEKVPKDATVIADLDDEPELVISPKMKRQKAMLRAISTLKEIQHAEQSNTVLSNFVYTPVVRKLPASSSYVTQQIYENRSPLHNVNNVNFKFNSHATRFNMHEWGLEALPNWSAKIAKTLCYDANTMAAKLKSIKIPARLQKVKNEYDEHGEEVDEVRSSFFTNAMTQTDDVTITTAGGRNRNKHSIGIQVATNLSSFGTQTDLALSGNPNSSSVNDDLPLMRLINVLNENQLLALNDFAELIREPASNAIDMYRLRQRMLDIYKCSQLESALATLPSTSISTSSNHQPHNVYYNPQRIADPRQRSTSDPRLAEHRQRPTSSSRMTDPRQRPKPDLRMTDPRQRPTSDPRMADPRQRPVDPRLVDKRPHPTDPRHYATFTANNQPQEPPPPPIYSPTPAPPPPPTAHIHPSELFNPSRNSSTIDVKPKFFGRGGLRR